MRLRHHNETPWLWCREANQVQHRGEPGTPRSVTEKIGLERMNLTRVKRLRHDATDQGHRLAGDGD
jgi:hypothetical protein